MKKLFFPLLLAMMAGQACSPSRSAGSSVVKPFFEDSSLRSAQIGICIYDPVKAIYLYDRQGDKYFIPASNTKLFTLYAGLKWLGDSLVGMRYLQTDTAIFIIPSGDPSFLHPDYVRQPVMDFLKKTRLPVYLTDVNWREKALGRGWAWDDYNDDYAAERSPLPVYGNVIRWVQDSSTASFYSIPDINWEVRFTPDTVKKAFFVQRDWDKNAFEITEGKERYKVQDVPFVTGGVDGAAVLLKDTVGRDVFIRHRLPAGVSFVPRTGLVAPVGMSLHVIHSRPLDSLFRPMMYRSDNFFAEQTLLMVSNERLGWMNDARIIDTLLKTDLKELPQRPNWVDGSGLSRNDLFTPRDFVWLLDKMQREFSLSRMKGILPTGGSGTLGNYYKKDSGYIYAKTGSLTGVVTLSGYLVTKKDHLLIFSIMVNNHNDPAIRRKMEKFLEEIREKY